jgi:hypothetical protein
MKMKKIVIEVDFKEFRTLEAILKEILNKAKQGQQYEHDASHGMYVKTRYEYFLDFIEQTPWEEKEIDGEIHCIIKSKL